ncbi:MAG: acyl-CoA dehydrogenase family protein [Myxococcota bacterium]
MNFDFSEDQKLLQKTARDFLAENCSLEVPRAILESDRSYDEGLWKGVAEMGWLGAAVPEEYGGAGFGQLELAVLAEEIGRSLAPIPFGPSVYLATEALMLAGKEEQKSRYLPRLASGESIGTLAIAEGPGSLETSTVETRLEGGTLHGVKLPVLDGDIADLAVVAAHEGRGVSLALVDLSGPGVSRTPIESIDPSRSLARIEFDGAPAEQLGGSGQGTELAERVLDRAAVLMAFEQLGGADATFEQTHAQTMGRFAFGRPVASFQAVKHRMADIWAKLQLARSNCYYGAWALENQADELGIAAALSRVAASEAYEWASQENIQLHGGVGFTWEYDCHLFYRRAMSLAVALGGTAEWREKLIARVERAS